MRILVLEDNPDDFFLIRKQVEKLSGVQCELENVTYLKEAKNRLKMGGIDLVLCDLNVPDSNGVSTFLELIKAMPDIPVVILTGSYLEEKTALEAVRNGAQDYLVKQSLTEGTLSRAIRYAIERANIRRELQTTKANLEKISLLDPLTELPNRRGFQEILSRESQRARREGTRSILLFLDIDNFKLINDTIGHSAGDRVLQEAVRRLVACLRTTDYAARIGGDEFMVLLTSTRQAEGVLVGEKVRSAIAGAPFPLGPGQEVKVTASIGVTDLSPDSTSIDELLVKTHEGLHRSKLMGKNRVSSDFDAAGGENFEDKIKNGIFEALRQPEKFHAIKHPILSLTDSRVLGYEFLSRFDMPGFSAPEDFFRVSREYNILTEVDLRCFKSCLSASLTLPAGNRHHLNLFPSTLVEVSAEKLLREFSQPPAPGSYCLEISEQQIMGSAIYLAESVKQLKQAGLLIAIDDAGFGRGSLESLILLEPDIVKIERGCVIGIAKNPSLVRVLKRILEVARSLGAEIIAEGIETEEDLEVLKSLGVKFGQGSLWENPKKSLENNVKSI